MPTSVTVQMFYIGNFTDMDTDETDQDNENPNVVLGTYGSLNKINVTQNDIDDDGVIYDDEFATGDTLTFDTGGGSLTTALDNTSLYNANILLGDGSTISVRVLVIQAANGDVFVSEYPPEPLDGLAIQTIELASLDTSNASGINQGFSSVENTTVVCYARGTMIETVSGAIAVETIRPGDKVMSIDHGPQVVRWVHRQTCVLPTSSADTCPVLIKKNTLGPNRPSRDLIVSPQHRILVGGAGQLGSVFASEVFVPAKALTKLKGICRMNGLSRIDWVHFACDRHEVVLANGCYAESLLLGPMALAGMSPHERAQISGIFGSVGSAGGAVNGPAARPCLTVKQARNHMRGPHLHPATPRAVAHNMSVPAR